jgi:hypothetical protein
MGALLAVLMISGITSSLKRVISESVLAKNDDPMHQSMETLCYQKVDSEYIVPTIWMDFIHESTEVDPFSFFLIRQFDDRERILIQLEFLGTGIVVDRFYGDSILIETTETIRTNGRLKKVQYVGVCRYLVALEVDRMLESGVVIRLPDNLIDPDWLDYMVRAAIVRNPTWRLPENLLADDRIYD